MQGSLKNPYKNFEMCHNFFGWGDLDIIPKYSIFFNFLGPKNLFFESMVIFGLRKVDFRGVVLLMFSESTKISLQYSTKISIFFKFLASKP